MSRLSIALAALVLTGCAPGQLYDTPVGQVSLHCVGEPADTPTVVFLSAAGDRGWTQWQNLQDAVDDHSCIFDPPGVGAAAEPASLLTPTDVALAMESSLPAAGAPGPYMFVAHSHGGLNVRVFGERHGENIHSALLLDPMVPQFLASDTATMERAFYDPEASAQEGARVVKWPGRAIVWVLSHDGEQAVAKHGWPADVQAAWDAGQMEYKELGIDGTQNDMAGTEGYIHRETPDSVFGRIETLRAFDWDALDEE